MRDPKVVWAKFARYPFWPALTVDPDSLTVDEVTKLKTKANHILVRFFGTHDFSWIAEGCIMDFEQGKIDKLDCKSKSKLFHRGVQEAEEFLATGKLPQPFHHIEDNNNNKRSYNGESKFDSSPKKHKGNEASPKKTDEMEKFEMSSDDNPFNDIEDSKSFRMKTSHVDVYMDSEQDTDNEKLFETSKSHSQPQSPLKFESQPHSQAQSPSQDLNQAITRSSNRNRNRSQKKREMENENELDSRIESEMNNLIDENGKTSKSRKKKGVKEVPIPAGSEKREKRLRIMRSLGLAAPIQF